MTITYSAHSSAPPLQQSAQQSYSFAAGYLRAFLTVLVVAHHAVLAYTSFAPPAARSLLTQPQWWQAFPVIDSRRWSGFDLLIGFNDTFFMSLLFFLSGLFVWRSLQNKGASQFLSDRARRLGLPFLAAVGLLAPLAYYPAYLMTDNPGGFSQFTRQWISLGHWPAGPAWFLSLLLAFDCLAALLFTKAPQLIASRRIGGLPFGFVVIGSALAYIPMTLTFDPLRWSVFGPFTFQTSRVFHYALYFFFGAALGSFSLQRGLLSHDGKLARRWRFWLLAAFGAFVIQTAAVIIALSSHATGPLMTIGTGFTFVLSCATISFGCLALFARFADRRICTFDSLRDNAYGIYVVHYIFVNWLQYFLLQAPVPAVLKGLFVFSGALALSWVTTAALRRISAVARVI